MPTRSTLSLDLGIKAPRLLKIRVILQPGPHEITEKKKSKKLQFSWLPLNITLWISTLVLCILSIVQNNPQVKIWNLALRWPVLAPLASRCWFHFTFWGLVFFPHQRICNGINMFNSRRHCHANFAWDSRHVKHLPAKLEHLRWHWVKTHHRLCFSNHLISL